MVCGNVIDSVMCVGVQCGENLLFNDEFDETAVTAEDTTVAVLGEEARPPGIAKFGAVTAARAVDSTVAETADEVRPLAIAKFSAGGDGTEGSRVGVCRDGTEGSRVGAREDDTEESRVGVCGDGTEGSRV